MEIKPLKVTDGESILCALERANIVSFRLHVNGLVIVEEECDNYFCRSMTKEQLTQLISELQAARDALL